MKRLAPAIVTFAFAICFADTTSASLVTELRAYFDFENGFTNSVAGGPDGTGRNGAVAGVVGGIVGNAMELRSTGGTANEHMNVAIGYGAATATPNNLGRNFTISVWYNLDNPPAGSTSGRYFVFEGQTDFDASFGIRNLNLGVPGINDGQFFTTGAGNNRNVADAALGGWRHVAQTFSSNGTTTFISNFLDGTFSSSFSVPTSGVSDSGLNFGAPRNSVTDRGFDGKIDEVALWSRALTSGEVAQVYNLGVNGIGVTAVPEPTSLVLVGLIGSVGAVVRHRRLRAVVLASQEA